MTTNMRIVLGVSAAFVALIVMVAAIAIGSYIKWHNFGNQSDQTIIAEYDNMQNILAQGTTAISEAAQIPAMQTEDLQAIFSGALQARYGGEGSQATFQWIQEQNPNLDQATYIRIQQMIESFRNRFENAQTKFIDTRRVYNNNLGNLWSGFWISAAGFPKIDLEEYTIISSTHARQTFDSGIDDGIQLR